MRIAIELNGVLRDTLKKIQQEYEKWYLENPFKEDDEKAQKKVQAKNNLENYIYNVRTTVVNDEKMKTSLGSEHETVSKMVDDTIKWLDDNNIEYDALFMRGKNDYRKSPVVKSDLIEEMKCHDYIPVYAIEDRDDCIDMFNSLGIFTLKVYNSVPA